MVVSVDEVLSEAVSVVVGVLDVVLNFSVEEVFSVVLAVVVELDCPVCCAVVDFSEVVAEVVLPL